VYVRLFANQVNMTKTDRE